MTLMDETTARYQRFLNSPVAQEHKAIREEIISELHLEFEQRENGMHAVCAMCRGSVSQLTQKSGDHETSYALTLENMATLFMVHYMNRHYTQEGRRG